MVRVVTPGTLTDAELLNDKSDVAAAGGACRRAQLLRPGLAQRTPASCGWPNARRRPRSLDRPHRAQRAALQRRRDARLRAAPEAARAPRPSPRRGRRGSSMAASASASCWNRWAAPTWPAWNAESLANAHAAAAALLGYAEHTQGRALAHVQRLAVERDGELIDLPPTTRRNLELVQTLRGEDSPTLFSLLDTCMTGMGSRLLAAGCSSRGATAQARAAARSHRRAARRRPRRHARGAARQLASDVERIAARIALRQVRPRELLACGDRAGHAEQLAPPLPAAAALLAQMPSSWRRRRLRRTAGRRDHRRALGPGARRRRDRHRPRRRARRAARHQRELRRLPARARNQRARAHRHQQPAGAVQPRPRLLHRGHAERLARCPTTTAAARR